MPLTVNQLLLGRSTTTTHPTVEETPMESYMAVDAYQEELMQQWWNEWKIHGLPYIIPYQRYEDAKRDKNLEKGDLYLPQ